MARTYSLAYLTVSGTPPVEHIKMAAEAGYDYVSLRTIPMHLPNEPLFLPDKDPQLRKDIEHALKDYNMGIFDMELARVREDLDVYSYEAAFDTAAQLGCKRVLSSIWTEDKAYRNERFGIICDLAAKYGMTVNLEFMSLAGVRDDLSALEVLNAVQRPNARMVVDTLYVQRSQIPVERLKQIDPKLLGFIHLCDGPKGMPELNRDDAFEVVRGARLYPGEGVIDIKAIVEALPPVNFSIELPNVKQVEQRGMAGHAAQCLKTAKAYFQKYNID